jgi:hypothetical protein
MAELAIKPMTLDEFLRWDDGTETHYELIAGFPAVIARSIEAQRVIAVRLATRIDAGLSGRRPCRALIQAGVIAPERADTYFVARYHGNLRPGRVGATGDQGSISDCRDPVSEHRTPRPPPQAAGLPADLNSAGNRADRVGRSLRRAS